MSQHLDHVTPAQTWQPSLPAPAAELELYAVPVPDAVPVTLPDGRTAWAREIAPRLAPADVAPASASMPGWAKGIALASAALSTLTLSGGLAMRIAAPALGPAVEFLDMVWKVALVLAVLVLGVGAVVRSRLAAMNSTEAAPAPAVPVEIHVGDIRTGSGGRWLSRGGDVKVSFDLRGER
ncbi:hypothetical protein ACODT4_44700 [Streptomyces sp. 2.9]|uniref:hypothetical protein n=1 Tax=Streptomyces tritrimontium TaxID=3406573 RepID=UPI003BB61A29